MKRFIVGLVAAFAALFLVVPPVSAAPTAPTAVVSIQPVCSSGYYENAYGNCVKRPSYSPRKPAGATAKCRDGTYSFSQSRRGTCSWHGGVARWY